MEGSSDKWAEYENYLARTNDLEMAKPTILEENARRANEFASSMETISGLKQGDKISTEELE